MDKLRSILVGADFTTGSQAALQQATHLARASGGGGGAIVRAIHVINTHVVIDLQHALSPMQKNIQASLETEAKREWLKFAHDLPGKDSVNFVVRVGNPTSSILDEVEASAADLLVLGIHKEDGSESGAGTVAGACVRKAKCRVLLVRPEQSGPFKRVVACLDFSDVSRRAVLEAARLARLEGASLDIVHVFEPPWRQLHYFAPMSENSPEFQAGYRAEVVSKMRNLCEPMKAELAGVTHAFKLEEHHSAGRGIIEYATNNPVDLIVLGTQGRSNLRDVLLGSTAERLLRQTPCSILTVRPE
jgi:universal stress protein E